MLFSNLKKLWGILKFTKPSARQVGQGCHVLYFAPSLQYISFLRLFTWYIPIRRNDGRIFFSPSLLLCFLSYDGRMETYVIILCLKYNKGRVQKNNKRNLHVYLAADGSMYDIEYHCSLGTRTVAATTRTRRMCCEIIFFLCEFLYRRIVLTGTVR